MNIRIINTGTPEYEQMKMLRLQVLLNPIGVPASYINPEKEKGDLLIAAFEGENIIGCCILTPGSNQSIQLRQMAVDTKNQGTGVGAAIIEFAELVAKEKGYRSLFLNARDPVIPFYEKCGYQVEGDQFFEVNIPHHRMEKELVN